MFWIIVDRCVNLTFLLLAIVIMSVLVRTSSTSIQTTDFSSQVMLVKQEALKAIGNNVNYFETRINRLSEQQDNYQNSTDQRLLILEQQIKPLMLDKKNSQKININNSSNAIIYEK